MKPEPIVIVIEDNRYVGYLFGKQITKQNSIEKCLKKLLSYAKSQG